MEKSAHTQSVDCYESDEISLVDLVKVLIKWRWLEIAVWALCMIAGVAYAVLAPHTIDFKSVYQVAMDGNKPLESPAEVISKIKYSYEPDAYQELVREGASETVSSLNVNISNPGSTSLIVINTKATKSKAKAVHSLHDQIFQSVEREQGDRLKQKQNTLRAQLKAIDQQMGVLQVAGNKGEKVGTEIAAAMALKSSIQQNLAELAKGQVLVLGQSGSKSVGHSRALFVVLAFVLGVILSMLVGFMAEFVGVVKASYRN